MKHKKMMIALLVLLVLLAAAAVVQAGNTYHWMLENGDDAYVLCANGQFTIDVNGDDSIHLVCHSGAGLTPAEER